MKFFTKVKEIRSREGVLHFERYAFIETPFFALYHHTIHRADEDKHLHSHPWNACGLILSGSYEVKESLMPRAHKIATKKPGDFSFMSRHDFHKISKIVDGPVKTLFFTFGRHKPWHYMVNGKKIEASEYRKMKRAGAFGEI